jgi:hypothetical protein
MQIGVLICGIILLAVGAVREWDNLRYEDDRVLYWIHSTMYILFIFAGVLMIFDGIFGGIL